MFSAEPSPSPGAQEGGGFGSQHQPTPVQSNCPACLGPLTGRWTRAGASWALARSQVRSTGSEAAEGSGVGEPEAGGLRTQSGAGAPCVNPGRRAGGSDTHYRQAGNEPAAMAPWRARSVPPRCAGSASRLGASRPRRPGPRGGERPGAEPAWGRRGRAGRRRGGAEPRRPAPTGSLPRSGLGSLCKTGGPRRGG